MTSKKYVIKTIAYTAAVLAIICAIVIVIDPFSHYHMPYFGMAPVETDERSALIGVAQHDDYDTVLLGSSMSENFQNTWFEDGICGEKCVKICLQGAHFPDYKIILDEIIDKPSLKKVYFSLDTYLLTNDPDKQNITIPEYLYNDKLLDDTYYLLNKSVLCQFIPIFIINNIRTGGNEEKAYVWSDDFEYNKYSARHAYILQRPVLPENMKPFDTYFENADVFLESITPYIEKRPDVEFVFYSAPYSMLFWDFSVRNGDAEAEVCALERVMNSLLQHENTRIFYFQDDLDIVTDLNNYRDYSHFKQDINYYMYECMRDGKKEVTKDTYFDKLLDMYNYAMDYDYESLFH